MPMTLRHSLQFVLAFVASSFVASQVLPRAQARKPAGSRSSTAKTSNKWDQVGKSNWHLADDAVIADKMDDKEAGYLVSKKPYKDFVLLVEFWPSDP